MGYAPGDVLEGELLSLFFSCFRVNRERNIAKILKELIWFDSLAKNLFGEL